VTSGPRGRVKQHASASATLSSGLTEVHHAYVVRDDADASEHAAEVIVLGPRADAGGLVTAA
jgi:hypothetical protein